MKRPYVVAKFDSIERLGPANDIPRHECRFEDFAVVEADSHEEALKAWGKRFNTKIQEPVTPSYSHTHTYIDFNEQYYIVAIAKKVGDG